MRLQLQHWLSWTSHVQDLNIVAVDVECTHVIRVRGVERNPQERRRRRPPRCSSSLRGHARGLGCRGLIQDGRVLERPEVKRTERAVRADGHEDVGGPG